MLNPEYGQPVEVNGKTYRYKILETFVAIVFPDEQRVSFYRSQLFGDNLTSNVNEEDVANFIQKI